MNLIFLGYTNSTQTKLVLARNFYKWFGNKKETESRPEEQQCDNLNSSFVPSWLTCYITMCCCGVVFGGCSPGENLLTRVLNTFEC